jgi:hypothetical protein
MKEDQMKNFLTAKSKKSKKLNKGKKEGDSISPLSLTAWQSASLFFWETRLVFTPDGLFFPLSSFFPPSFTYSTYSL